MSEKQCIEKEIIKVNKTICNPLAYNVEISVEGYNMYRRNLDKLGNSVQTINGDKSLDKELCSKAIIDITGLTQSNFHSQFKKLNTQTKESKENNEDCGAMELARNCFEVYISMYDEIKRGYADGTRELWILDKSAEGGFRKITEKEELEALDSAYEFYVQVVDAYVNTGMRNSEIIGDAVNRLKAELQNQEYVSKSQTEEKDEVVEDLYSKLINSANSWKEAYSVDASNLSYLFNQIFKDNFKVTVISSKE